MFSFRYHSSFLSFTPFLIHGFQSLILRTLNFRSLLNRPFTLNLWYITFNGQYTVVVLEIKILMKKAAVIITVCDGDQYDCILDTKFVNEDWPLFGYSLVMFFTVYSSKVQPVLICLSNLQTLPRYQKSIGKRQNYRSKMWKGIFGL